MIPCDLEDRKFDLPATDQHSIVLFTDESHGNLVCERFALRMRQEFGDQVVAWFTFRPKSDNDALPSWWVRFRSSIKRELKLVYRRPPVVFSWLDKLRTMFRVRILGQNPLSSAQDKLLGEEVRSLRAAGVIFPTPVEAASRPEFVAELKRLNPYFFLSLGEPPQADALRPAVRGIMLNQHVGWCPDYRGAHAVYWAMFYRDLNSIGATIHETTAAANAGSIFRRASACLLPTDDAFHCFTRSAVLGTELMCETVREIIANKRATVCDQPRQRGRTHRSEDLDREVRQRIREDFAGQWLGSELRRCRDY